MKCILGTKMNMTQVWQGDRVIPVTPVSAGPCTVTKVKTVAKDGYQALQLAYGERKAKNISKPVKGQLKDLNLSPRYLKEFRTIDNATPGNVITVDTFVAGDIIAVTGTSKGKGFQGVVKRHGFHGFRKTHGNKDQQRAGGSVGPKGPAHVFKGTKMPGRMGNARVTVTNLEIVSVDEANNLLFIKGALPGAVNSLVMISGKGDLKLNDKMPETKVEEPVVIAEEAIVEPEIIAEPIVAEEVKVEESVVEPEVIEEPIVAEEEVKA